MIRYVDASALVKRYVREEGSARVVRLLRGAAVATARYSLVEVVSALARRARAGDLATAELERIAEAVEEDAQHLVLVELTPSVASRARRLLLEHALRAGDAIQLASCLALRDRADPRVRLVAFDERLNLAARAVGLPTL